MDSYKFPKGITEETVIAEWSAEIFKPHKDDTVESVTRMCLAGLFITAGHLIQDYDVDATKFQEAEKITLAFQKAGWNEAFVLRLTKVETP